MNTAMTAADQAAEVARVLKGEDCLVKIQRHEAVVSEIPLDGAFGIVLNLFIAPEAVARPTLWALTVPLIRKLADSGKLSGFKIVEVRVMTTADGKSSERVLSFRSTVEDIGELPAKEEADLFQDNWDGNSFDCYWYRDKNAIPA